MNATGGDIIKLKDQIHTQWYELQGTKRANKDYAFLMKPVYDEIVRLGHEALDTLKAIDPQSPFIQRIEGPLHETQLKSWIAEDIAFIGPKPYYVMIPERGQDVITQDINRLANEVHHAGMSLIKAREQYCGCEISEHIEDLSSINTGVLKYCEGALMRGRRRAWIHAPGDTVEHKPGSADEHANTMQFTPTEKGYKIAMEYVESGDSNWRDRQGGVVKIIEAKGGQCKLYDHGTKCDIEDVAGEDILNLALIISQLTDIDLLDSGCIPMAFELIANQADELKEIEPKENIWEEPWTRPSDMTEIMECTGRGYEDDAERESRERTKERRFRNDVEESESWMQSAIHKSKTEPCTMSPYICLADNLLSQSIRESCERLKKETTYPSGWCMSLADQLEEDVKEAAKNLVDRCPPEGIILGIEASSPDYVLHDTQQIERICKLAENQDCLDIIRQVEARMQEGVKPEKLKMR